MKYIAKLVNGNLVNSSDIGFNTNSIASICTIIDKEKLFTQYDIFTGKKIIISDLQKVEPIHNHSVFIEDHWHDWCVKKDLLYFYPHSSKKGEEVEVLIELN